MFRQANCYSINLVFRGLFLAWPTAGKLTVFLPDVRDPGPSEVALERNIREHVGAVEFPVRNWKNRASGPRLIEVRKPNKEPVALSFLDRHEITVSSQKGTLRTPAVPPAVSARCNQQFAVAQGSSLLILDNDPDHALQELAQFGSKLVEDPNPRRSVVGWMELQNGFVRSERRSVAQVTPVEWMEVTSDEARQALQNRVSVTTLRSRFQPRLLNLDLRVVLVADEEDPLILDLRRGESVSQTFIIAPSDPGTDVTVWIKNRELKAILEDSDDLDSQASGCPRTIVDLDHEAFKALSANGIAGVSIPVFAREGDSDGGCSCGGTCPKPPGG